MPAAQSCKADYDKCIGLYNDDILAKARETAIRCHAIVFANAAYRTENGWRNTTFAFDREGNEVGHYFKAHPAPSEVKTELQGGDQLDVGYSYSFDSPYVLELEGLRFGFMTCYDFYFYENFAPLALQNVDIIIGCSHQRTDTHEALNLINRFLCYQTNAYLLRASVSLGEGSPICGSSCIIAPDGEMLVDMVNDVGLGIMEIDPTRKYYKAAGFRGVQKAHWQYIEEGRRPWLYRNGGPGVVPFDEYMTYPRICAHRGFSTVAPENTLPAFGAAVGLGAPEIEFDLWETTDGVIVSCHDDRLERISDGEGKVYEHTYEELLQYDFGVKFGDEFKGLRIATFEEILKRFGGRTIMNIHVKTISDDDHFPTEMIHKMVALIDKYDCRKHIYFMCTSDSFLEQTKALYPDICLCAGINDKPWDVVDRAIRIGCEKIQLFKPYFNQEMIDKAHAHGIICNVFWSDDPDEARQFLDMGIDTILSNDYLAISNAVGNYKKPYAGITITDGKRA